MFHKGGDGKPRGFGFGGFSLGNSKKQDASSGHSLSAMPPPTMVNKHGYTGLQAITQTALDATYGIPRKRPKTEEEYFEQEDDEETPSNSSALAYIPAPGSPSWDLANSGKKDSDSEEDPLDAFMAGLDDQVEKEKEHSEKMQKKKDMKGIREDIENEDDEESYYRYMEENPNAGLEKEESEGELEYDEDGNPIAPVKSKFIDPLPAIDHSEIEYSDFEKNFYEEHEEIAKLTPFEVEELRNKLGIKVTGPVPPKVVTSFAHFGFDEKLLKAIRKSEYTQPTPIQAQGIPAALSGRDVIGIAKTGSGKTAAFIWPLLVHIMDQKELETGDGPIGLILAPTRELSQQIYTEAKRFGKVYGIGVVCCFGGGSKWEQSKALQEGAEIVVATPGRMIDLIKAKATNLRRVTFLVLDEADRMFDMGFEPQVRSICDHVRPDRQTLMFSATFKRKIERLARDVLTDPVRIVQGELGEANEDVTQIVLVMPAGPAKWVWLTSKLVELLSAGSVLIFVTKKANAEELANNLRLKEYEVGLLHGDIDQNERSKVILSFKKKEVPILVATDVAARGLDITHVKTVVNYDIARDIDTHTHRIGRTGRAGEKGIAYTLVTDKDKEFAGHLVRNLEGANQAVPQALMDLAMQSSWFRKSRFKQSKGKKLNKAQGLGFRERPGLGSEEMVPNSNRVSSSLSHSTLPKFSGPQTDRLSAMKSAFQSQYKSQFTAATDTAWKMAAREEEKSRKERKKSRWDTS
ncbi:ATP-dependent RNA helicase DDX42 [Trichonephila inaurata madagascariensis]|uniref:ATP-dependent RNA helicase DDX42 n=1 Tax=Trichonephila inaurata madagascariensis TaxID=2747483 RepID=A0A8X6YQU5_9ARAC|nr:ATP-dependent RNA helicase DDX42 [Trichonephila inaurata madagascariensis]